MASLLLDDAAQPKQVVSAEGVQREVDHEHVENAEGDENGDEEGDHEVAVPLEHKIDTGEDNDRGLFEQYFVNTNNVDEKKRLPYIMMMFRALGFSIEEIYPYSEILSDRSLGGGGGGWIRSLKATKDLVAQELLRQNPKARLNKKNQTFEQLSSRIRPLTDSRDVDFILKEERKIRQKFYEVVTADRSKDGFIDKHATLGKGAFAENNQTKGSHAEVSKEKLNTQKAESPKIQGQNIQISLDDKEHILCPENKRQKTTGESQRDDRKPDAVSDCANEALFPSSYELSSVLADKAMNAAINFAVLRDWKITVAIVDAGGSPILMKRLDGASSASYDVALGKARNAARFIKSTGEIEKDAQGLDSVLHDSVLAPFISKRGGCPIVISDCSKCIGAIGVSGAPTATNDEQVANAGVTFITCLFSSQKR